MGGGLLEPGGGRLQPYQSLVHPALDPARPGQALVRESPSLEVGVGVEPVDRRLRQVHGQALASAHHRRERALVIQGRGIDALRTIVRRDGIPQLDRPLVGPGRVAEGAGIHGGPGGAHPRSQRADRLVRSRRVVCQRGHVAGAGRAARDRPRIEHRAVRRMQAAPLAREQVVVDGFRQQRVPEPIRLRPGGVDREDLRGDGLPQRTLDLGLAGLGHVRQQVGLDRATGDGRIPEDPLGVLR